MSHQTQQMGKRASALVGTQIDLSLSVDEIQPCAQYTLYITIRVHMLALMPAVYHCVYSICMYIHTQF